VDHELEVSPALELEEHLRRCDACRARYHTFRQLRATVGAAIAFTPAPDALRRRIAQRLHTQEIRARPWWARRAALVAVPAVLALVAATLVLVPKSDDSLRGSPVEKIVYHINEGTDPATALRNVANHLQLTPGLKAVVVAHNKGVDFLLMGARDDDGQLFEDQVAALKARGVDFRVCGNTLSRRHIDPTRVIPEAKLVPSGVAEIGRLQTKEGYAYMRL
jgi:hypothetical protein